MPEMLLFLNSMPQMFGWALVGLLCICAAMILGAYIACRMQDAFGDWLELLPRCSGWAVISIALVIAIGVLAPQNLPVIVYKVSLVTIAAVMGYYIDRAIFPYARPHKYSHGQQVGSLAPHISTIFAAVMIRRSVIVLACILGLTLGL